MNYIRTAVLDMYDLVIRGGRVIDGTGGPPRLADVAMDGDRIVAVGAELGPGRREIDATGLLVTPGWVDMHTHYDGQITWDPYLTPSGWHGVTTVVMGNCGVGFAPVRAADREWIINVMEGVEDIPGAALSEGIRWNWETFPEYLNHLEHTPAVLDFATQIPHSALRGFVMGRDDSEQEDEASDDQLAEMKALVKEALEAGALGFSTSRTSLHKTAAGVLVAGTSAARRELFAIGEALAETGCGVFEVADEHVTLVEDIQWLEALAVGMGRPVVVNLSQTDVAPNLWRSVLEGIEGAAERGAPLYAQSAGRSIGIVMNWRTTAHPFALHPVWQRLTVLPWEEQLAALRRPEIKAAILTDTPIVLGPFETFVTSTFSKMYPTSVGYEPSPDQSVAARASAHGLSATSLAYDMMLEDDGTGSLYFPLFNFTGGDLSPLYELHQHPRVRMGLSDGGAHCGAICDGGMPTFMLTHWTRDRSRGPTLPLEWVVHRQTQQTAEFYGLLDRGVLAPGYKADINVIDYEGLKLADVELVFDLPAGGRRLTQRAEGYVATVCSGVVTFENGEATGALPGHLIRGAQEAPVPALETAPRVVRPRSSHGSTPPLPCG